jgi:hypothetical protein
VALALSLAAGGGAVGRLSLRGDVGTPAALFDERPLTLAELYAGLEETPAGGVAHFSWRLDWGASIVLEARHRAARLSAAA